MTLEQLVNRLSHVTSYISQSNQEHQEINDSLYSDNKKDLLGKDQQGKEEINTGFLLQLEKTIDRLEYEKDRQIGLVQDTKNKIFDFSIRENGPVSAR